MTTAHIQSNIDHELILRTPGAQLLTVTACKLSLSTKDNEYIDCRVIFKVSYTVYEKIETQGGFHLQPEACLPSNSEPLKPDHDVEIEVQLSAHLLPQLTGATKTATGDLASVDEVAQFWVELSQTQPDHPLLLTESWYGLSVWQGMTLPPELGQGAVKQGYTTRWATEGVEGIISPLATAKTEQIYTLVTTFLTQEGIPFQELDEGPFLRVPINGENGFWSCFIEAREAERQCLIYSVYPERVPQYKRLGMAEFIARANYGLPMGCFEMHFDEGEIRLRTSINVESERFSMGLLSPLFYANTAIMDRYFKGIAIVLKGKAIAKQAITTIEEAEV